MARHGLRGRHSLLRIPHGQLHLRHIALQRCRELLPDTNQFAQRGDPPGPAGGRARQFLPDDGGTRADTHGGRAGAPHPHRGRGRLRQCLDAGIRRPRTRRGVPRRGRHHGRDAAARPDFGPARRTRGGGPHSRRDDLRADLRPSRTRRGPAGGFGRRRALARLPFLRPRDAPFPAPWRSRSAAACRARCNYAPNWPYARAEARWPASEAHMPTAR